MVFHWSTSDSKFPQVCRTLLCILAELNNPTIFNSFGTISKPVGIVPCAPVITGITVTYMFHNLLVLWQGLSFSSQANPKFSFHNDNHYKKFIL